MLEPKNLFNLSICLLIQNINPALLNRVCVCVCVCVLMLFSVLNVKLVVDSLFLEWNTIDVP